MTTIFNFSFCIFLKNYNGIWMPYFETIATLIMILASVHAMFKVRNTSDQFLKTNCHIKVEFVL